MRRYADDGVFNGESQRFFVPLGQNMAAVLGVTILARLVLPFLGYRRYGDRPLAGWQV